jgi:hypothetical protein
VAGYREVEGVVLMAREKIIAGMSHVAIAKESILEEAIRMTGGDRNTDYGSAVDDFKRIASMWNILFSGGKANGECFKPADVALAMCCVKLSRQSHKPKRDSWVDIAGYAHCGNQCDEDDANNAKPSGPQMTAKQKEFFDSESHFTVFYKSRCAGGTLAAKEAAKKWNCDVCVPSRAMMGESGCRSLGSNFNPDKLRGLSSVVIDNFNLLQPSDWGKFTDTLLGIRNVKIVCDVETQQFPTSEPIRVLRHLSTRLGKKSFRVIYANASDNPHLPPECILKLLGMRDKHPSQIVFDEDVQ